MQQTTQHSPIVVPGGQVLVRWSDGGEYPARVLEVVRGQARCQFPNGNESWVAAEFLRPLEVPIVAPPRWIKWVSFGVCLVLGLFLFLVASGGRSTEAALVEGAMFGGPVLFAALVSLFISARRSLAGRIVTIVGVAIAGWIGLVVFFEVFWRML